MVLYHAGEYENAEAHLKELLDLARGGDDVDQRKLARALNQLGLFEQTRKPGARYWLIF